jgi:predicted AlkP superfamily pyrophosphatase or phosphodiesterase
MRLRSLGVMFFAALAFLPFSESGGLAQSAAPRLVLQITVDQLRGDMPSRYIDRMGEGGFRYMLDNGVVFADAHHAHANTETIVGHATLATGAHPAAHGMIGNVWLDRETGFLTYNIEDPRYRLVTAGADVDRAREIDPTQRAARSEGRSPAAIMVSTFSDELAIASAGKAKVFGVSIKDRGAVSMAGHAGKAFWFSKSAGEFVSSDFYYDAYPEWVVAWNAGKPASRYSGEAWELLHDRSTYVFGERDDQPWETAMPGFGRTFPHAFGDAEDAAFNTYLTLSPAGDRLTLDFAKALIENEEIGADAITDYLSVSFSSTDYVGHLFGPASLETEDNLLQLDRTLAELLAFVDERVGLDQTVIVLSADHGGPEVPADLDQYGFETDYVAPDTWETQAGFAALKELFGIGEDLISRYEHPYVYLNRELIEAEGLDQARVEAAVAAEIVKFPGVALAVSSTALARGEMPDTPLIRSVLNNYSPKRSGDVFVVFAPGWFINDFDGLTVPATHGSPWSYDTFVPVIFAAPGVQPRTVHRRIYTVDVAPTLSALLGIKPPSGSRGNVLVEALHNR